MIMEAIKAVIEGRDLTEEQTVETFEVIMEGNATPAQIGALLTALRMKGETEAEIAGAARVMRAKAARVLVDGDLVDTCGTGGDGAGTFNISTAAALVAAGAGLKVAKHGNRAASSKCGSADVLEALGVKVDCAPDHVATCIRETNIGFMFAPVMHAAMKHAIGPRKEMGVRTIFNVLGPLTNPAGARSQVMGVFAKDLAGTLAGVLGRLGSLRAMIVHGSDGLDEITLTGPTYVAELKDGKVSSYTVDPAEFGLKKCAASDLHGGSAEENAAIIRDILDGRPGPKRDVTVLNAAAALMVAGMVDNLKDGIDLACKAIDSGAAKKCLDKFVNLSNGS